MNYNNNDDNRIRRKKVSSNDYNYKGASLMGKSNIYLHGNIKCTKACKTCLYI